MSSPYRNVACDRESEAHGSKQKGSRIDAPLTKMDETTQSRSKYDPQPAERPDGRRRGIANRSDELAARLRLSRHRRAIKVATSDPGGWLDPDAVLSLAATEELVGLFHERLQSEVAATRCWSTAERGRVEDRLTDIARSVGERRVVWLRRVGDELLGIQISAAQALTQATEVTVTRAYDLMLATPGAIDGICVELNYSPVGDLFELYLWGAFATEASDL